MAEHTEISWADATFNPWVGCTKVSPACDHCYAESYDKRTGGAHWGPGTPRRRTTVQNWNKPIRWNKDAKASGTRPRVFCASLADVFDNDVPDEWRDDLWRLIRGTPNLRWLLLTKRIGNAQKMLPTDWLGDSYLHVGIMATIANQDEWKRDWPKLARLPAPWRGLSMEPLLGPIDMRLADGDPIPDWIITGGESGAGFRETNPDWVRSIRDQCAESGIAFHHKQWSGLRPKLNGCLLDGREHKDFPRALT